MIATHRERKSFFRGQEVRGDEQDGLKTKGQEGRSLKRFPQQRNERKSFFRGQEVRGDEQDGLKTKGQEGRSLKRFPQQKWGATQIV